MWNTNGHPIEEMPNSRDAKFIDIRWVFNDIHVFFVLICLPTCPTFPPGSPEQQQINLAWPYLFYYIPSRKKNKIWLHTK